MTLPKFAVVGRVNEGKSSIISTLIENDKIRVGPEPGTTRRAQTFTMKCDGEPLFEVIDTPGFQEPEAALAWMKAREASAVDRPGVVRAFVETFRNSGEFADECELLQPILDGAFIVYVADGSHPFRPSYEAELEILRWTAAPRLALINCITRKDYSDEWHRALSQYFNIIREFNAHKSYFNERLELLVVLQALSPAIKETLAKAVHALTELDVARRREAVRIIAALVHDATALVMAFPSTAQALSEERRQQLAELYAKEMILREEKTRRRLEQLYNFTALERDEVLLQEDLLKEDLFSEETWQFFGLGRAQLVGAGALAGAAAGSALDLAIGGHSFFLGAIIGTVAGASSSAYLSYAAPSYKLIGFNVCGYEVLVGPVRSPNFPWIVLDRALLHYHALISRTHAMRTRLELASSSDEKIGLVSELNSSKRRQIALILAKLRKGRENERYLVKLGEELEPLLADAKTGQRGS